MSSFIMESKLRAFFSCSELDSEGEFSKTLLDSSGVGSSGTCFKGDSGDTWVVMP